jgi:hypothetical protein
MMCQNALSYTAGVIVLLADTSIVGWYVRRKPGGAGWVL